MDAQLPVPVSLVTHAHGDHLIRGHDLTIGAQDSLELLTHRLGPLAKIQTHPYGVPFKMNECWVSFHPAGHILGSSQIRIESKGEVFVLSGDYKRASDPSCASFETVKCTIFATESTFALPIYQWEPGDEVVRNIFAWWQNNASFGISSILFCYALGKAQRILSELLKLTDQPIYCHGSVLSFNEIYAKKNIPLLKALPIAEKTDGDFSKELILAPPSSKGSVWMRRFYPYKTAFASGWMRIRGMRKQRNVDAGFVLSDHADWKDILETIQETEAKCVLTMHGQSQALARYLKERGTLAFSLHGMEETEDEAD